MNNDPDLTTVQIDGNRIILGYVPDWTTEEEKKAVANAVWGALRAELWELAAARGVDTDNPDSVGKIVLSE